MVKLVRKHPKVNDGFFGRVKGKGRKCPICSANHTINEHRFHGVGSSSSADINRGFEFGGKPRKKKR